MKTLPNHKPFSSYLIVLQISYVLHEKLHATRKMVFDKLLRKIDRIT